MKYRLYENGNNDTSNVVAEVLKNRGVVDYKKYLNLDSSVVSSYKNLDNINEAVELFMKHFNNNNRIAILVDCDVDGDCSASMTYNYIKKVDSDYPVSYVLHKKSKAHGLSSKDYDLPDDTKLFIIPDAGTNDTDECKELTDRGIDVLILDHHESERKNPYAVIVNNQMSINYENKDLCGAGIVYRFLQALDDETWNEYADDFIDLCALGNISDVMDLRSFETRYFVNKGLSNVRNKAFKALLDAQEYSTRGIVNPHNIAWYITPILNGMIRVGSFEEKDLLFRAFIEQDEYFEYKKRATKNNPAQTIQESIYDRAARLCKNAKSRQDKLRDKGLEAISEIVDKDKSDNKIIMVDSTNILHEALTGVVAIRVADKYNKPCILLKKHNDGFGGSARNIDNSPIESFKDIVNSTGIFNGQGHSNAFGIINLKSNDVDKAIDVLNDKLKDVEYDSTYNCDYVLKDYEVDVSLINELSKLDNIICQGIDEPMIAIENINLQRSAFDIFGKNEDTISFYIGEIKCIQFKCNDENPLYDFLQNAWDDNDSVVFTIVGNPSINEYNGVKTPQIIIDDIEVLSVSNNNDTEDDDVW